MFSAGNKKLSQDKATNYFWPKIVDLKSAKEAAYYGVWAALLNAGATTLFIVLGFFGIRIFQLDALSLVDVGIFLIIAFGIYKLNRFASIAGLLFYLLEVVLSALSGASSLGVMTAILIALYVNSVRGTFAYHKFLKSKGR